MFFVHDTFARIVLMLQINTRVYELRAQWHTRVKGISTTYSIIYLVIETYIL